MNAAILILACLLAPGARADVVTFANGGKMSGVVLSQKDGVVELQVDEEGFVELSSSTVAGVEKQSAGKNAALKASWRERDRKAAAVEAKESAFAEKQRAKGLIFYEGDWMKPAEAEERLASKRLQAETQGQHAQAFVPDERTPDLPRPRFTYSQTFPYFLLPSVSIPPRRPRGRVFVFKNGHAVEKRGRVIDLSPDN